MGLLLISNLLCFIVILIWRADSKYFAPLLDMSFSLEYRGYDSIMNDSVLLIINFIDSLYVIGVRISA